MTKPHEETWIVEADGPEVEVHRVGGSVCDLNGPHARTPDDLARALLIAQAPAMARLLLAVEWSCSDGHDETRAMCPVCSGYESATQKGAAGHEEHCELATVLRQAGVLP